ncbi:MAG: energy transducer TonB [Xanthomonadales bacterium]|nr:energy transducer TonB [Xanthomonadales bacterium]
MQIYFDCLRRSRRGLVFPVGVGGAGLALALLLSACGNADTPSPEAGAAAADAAADTSALPVEHVQSPAPGAGDDAARGELALREQRLFVPIGDNAFELFLAAHEARPEDERSRLALQDLLPYAALHVEQRLAANDVDEAARVLALLARASRDAPAIPRLQAGLDALREREAEARAEVERAEATSIAAPAVSAPPAAPSPATSADASLPTVAVSAAPSEPAPTATLPQPTVAPASTAAEAQPQAPVVTAPPPVPEVVFQPALRYPAMAERRKLEGFVTIEFTIGADGSVSQLEVLRSQPEGVFDREARAALQRWRFAPPASPMRARRTLEFKLAR